MPPHQLFAVCSLVLDWLACYAGRMSEVTQLLQQIDRQDPAATERLFPLVYEELKRLAARRMSDERANHTLQSTALVHEAYVRLMDAQQVHRWESRGHFFAAAAEAMRRILIESARRKKALKRGGDRQRVTYEFTAAASDPDLILDIDAGLVRLAEEDPEMAEMLKLRLFGGLSVTDAGEMLSMSRSVAYRNWDYIRSWFAVNVSDV